MNNFAPATPESEPEFMPRMRRLFADGLGERQARLTRGLDGVEECVSAGRPLREGDLEELFLASHSLKGTAPGFGAEELGWIADCLCRLVKDWTPEAPPSTDRLVQAREFLAQIEHECSEAIARADAESLAIAQRDSAADSPTTVSPAPE
jgi:chemotaxis protein histidine kinase CheA